MGLNSRRRAAPTAANIPRLVNTLVVASDVGECYSSRMSVSAILGPDVQSLRAMPTHTTFLSCSYWNSKPLDQESDEIGKRNKKCRRSSKSPKI
jgi:hypothetical protein